MYIVFNVRNVVNAFIETMDIIGTNELNIVHEGIEFLDNFPFYDDIQQWRYLRYKKMRY